jgi:hypothetical protein
MDIDSLPAPVQPFASLLAVVDALPTPPPDSTPVREFVPGAWPTLGELRALVAGYNDLTRACNLLMPISLPHDVSGDRMRTEAVALIARAAKS